ncbi:hypothetical protein DFH07DRAFT_764462 [Mycena maculata]|uniref:Uncharacterized protein n=1 Tax=Mycena maculata TaxID=230809 RepID=A0AAD7KB89_9AGAR|nr:hypothetical protein DFH07DRAFT_764462 [Mycena maculata]
MDTVFDKVMGNSLEEIAALDVEQYGPGADMDDDYKSDANDDDNDDSEDDKEYIIPLFVPKSMKPALTLLEDADNCERLMESIKKNCKECMEKENGKGTVEKFHFTLSYTSLTPCRARRIQDMQPAAPLEASEWQEHELMEEIEKHHACQEHTSKAMGSVPDQLKIEDQIERQ